MAGSIWWIRRDLRLRDNPALSEALRHGPVTPVFILDPAALQSRYHRNAEKRRSFLFDGLRALDADLRSRGSRLIVRKGSPAHEMPQLLRETGADRVVAAEDYSPFAHRRDEALSGAHDLVLTPGITVHRPADVRKGDGDPFRVFTPFSRAWLALPQPSSADLLPAPDRLPPVDTALISAEIPPSTTKGAFDAGEAAGLKRLEAFTRGRGAAIWGYADGRNMLGEDATSVLSPYLRFGMVSPREAVVRAIEARDAASTAETKRGASTWLNELIWREFYLSVLYHFPDVLRREFDANLRGITWLNNSADIEAWQQGRTGYPVIDAAMRQLLETGWMHNRARMIVASFLVKNLLCDWRIGERWFMDHLIDGDPAANNGGWQWTAGVGTDAAPYFRVFNPVLQAKKFDPQGAFVRQWLPELTSVPDRYVHEPWLLPPLERRTVTYPEPIADLGETRERALAAYNETKQKRT